VSITLMAYPMAFLISPEEAKNERIQLAKDNPDINKAAASRKLRFIRVLSNIQYNEFDFNNLMEQVGGSPVESYYLTSEGLKVKLDRAGKYIIFNLSGCGTSDALQACGEKFFKDLDSVTGRNVRLIESGEFFYYNYETNYTDMKDIYTNLKSEGAKGIFSTANKELVATLNGQSIKYYKPENEKHFMLEVEQRIAIVNIGLHGKSQGNNVNFGLTNLKIQTNIKKEELKQLLHKANYLYYEADAQTPLKSSDAILNWSLKNGCYVAEFSGSNNAAITKEAEIIFRKLNIAAGRDLRLINDTFTTVYTYKTNYMDKGVLLNTLTEHGAEEIEENGDEVTCVLFGMEMVYHKKDTGSSYTLDITRVTDKDACQDVINDLNDEYGLNIQEATYNKIKERLEAENMRLESEAVMDDNSIVLTIEV